MNAEAALTASENRRPHRLSPPGFLRAIALVAGLEFGRAMQRRRLFLLNVLIPLAVTVPIAFSGAPAHHAVAVYAVQFILFGTFGAAIPALRDAETGIMSRLRATALAPTPLLLGRSAAGAGLDLIQLMPSVAVILLATHAGPSAWFAVHAVLLASLFIANNVGLWVAAIARSVAEGALFAAVAALLLLHASGVFRTPLPGSIGAAFERVAPFRALHEAILAAGTTAPPAFPLPLILETAATLVITALTARIALRSLASADSR
jgi:ABC-2 type transporter